MPNWIKVVQNGILACILCESVVVRTIIGWSCSEPQCRNYDDAPVEQRQGFAGWVNPDPSVGTASLASGSSTPIVNFGETRSENNA